VLAVIVVQDHVQFARIACMVYQPRVMNTDTPYTSPVRELNFNEETKQDRLPPKPFNLKIIKNTESLSETNNGWAIHGV
jgi:hypothetical protein